MNINSIDFNLLKVFSVLYQKPNASEAAIVLGLSQPAVSHALQRLRDTFGDPLFVRGSRGLIITPRARELGPFVVNMIKELEEKLAPRGFNPKEDVGVFRLKSTDYFEQSMLPNFVSHLRTEAPRTQIISKSTQGILPKAELEEGSVDLAIAGFFGELPNGFYQQKIFEDKLVGLCRKNHPYLKNKSLKEWLKCQHMLVSAEGKLEGQIDRALLKQKKKREVALSISSFMPSGWIVQNSDLVIAIPGKLARQLSAVLPLTTFELPLEQLPIQIVQVWHESVHQDVRHQWMRKKLFDICHSTRNS